MASETLEKLQNLSNISLGERNVKRKVRLSNIIKQIREGPKKIGELRGSSRSTRYNDADFLIGIGVAKTLEDGCLAWIDYSPLEEEIVKAIQEHRKKYGTDPSIDRVASYVYKDPGDREFRKAFWSSAKKVNWNLTHVSPRAASYDSTVLGIPWHPPHQGAEPVHNTNECPAPEKYDSSRKTT